MYLCILILPFLSFISCICFGRFIGTSGSCFLSTSAIFLAFLLSVFAFFETAVMGSACNIHIAQ
jgi:NADH:ubiquinone oxidoreductase subunit 5 (subunit L)/multisubunit Na+/H+ antiporter MnhA subunit